MNRFNLSKRVRSRVQLVLTITKMSLIIHKQLRRIYRTITTTVKRGKMRTINKGRRKNRFILFASVGISVNDRRIT